MEIKAKILTEEAMAMEEWGYWLYFLNIYMLLNDAILIQTWDIWKKEIQNFLQEVCSLSPAEEWKRREAEFSQKWSCDRGLGRIATFQRIFPPLGVQQVQLCSQPSHPFIPIVIMHFNSICKLFFSLRTNVLAGIWCCDKSINLLHIFAE